jgi:hypothetical protein
MDPNNDVMLAQEMNDLPLHPDHGYVRVPVTKAGAEHDR